jgi:DNA-binding NtrC family response regulator
VLNGAAPPLTRRKQGQITSLREIERDHIRRVLAHCNWNRSAAASILEIDRKTLRSKIREFGFTPPPGK